MTVELTVFRVYPGGTEEALSSGRFVIGQEYSGVVFFPDEEAARTAAIEYVRKLAAACPDYRFVVRRIQTDVVYETALPRDCGRHHAGECTPEWHYNDRSNP